MTPTDARHALEYIKMHPRVSFPSSDPQVFCLITSTSARGDNPGGLWLLDQLRASSISKWVFSRTARASVQVASQCRILGARVLLDDRSIVNTIIPSIKATIVWYDHKHNHLQSSIEQFKSSGFEVIPFTNALDARGYTQGHPEVACLITCTRGRDADPGGLWLLKQLEGQRHMCKWVYSRTAMTDVGVALQCQELGARVLLKDQPIAGTIIPSIFEVLNRRVIG